MTMDPKAGRGAFTGMAPKMIEYHRIIGHKSSRIRSTVDY